MAGFLDQLGNVLSGGFQYNPGFIAGIQQINPQVGDALTQAAVLNAQQQEQQRQQMRFQNEQADQQRQLLLQQRLPEVLQNIDWNNPQSAQSALASLGLKPSEMATLFGIHTGGEELGLKKEGLGLERQALGLRQQQLANELSGEVSPAEAAKIEKELRGEIFKESGEYKTVKSAYSKVQAAAKNPSPANDVALLYGYMKLLDPGSVVRESEYATAQNAAGVPEQVRNIFNKALTGEKLTPEQRKDFVRSSKGLYRTQVESYKNTTNQFKELAGQYKVNPKNVVLFEPEELAAEEENVMPFEYSNPAERKIVSELQKLGLSEQEIANIGRQ
jgi:hypothetical protein